MSGPPARELTRSERAAIRRLVTELCANYDSQEKLCLPLDCSCYMLHKWWTGSYCRYFEKTVLPTDPALESALTGEDTSLRQKNCPVCGKSYLPVTSQAYCSDACRMAARRKSERERKRRERQVFSRLSGCCLQVGYIRILPASKTALSCGHFI